MQYVTFRSEVVANGKSFSIQGYRVTGEPEPLEKCLTFTNRETAEKSLSRYCAHMRKHRLTMTTVLVKL
jgi:hypothetical protein